jgi:hypothetical protein
LHRFLVVPPFDKGGVRKDFGFGRIFPGGKTPGFVINQFLPAAAPGHKFFAIMALYTKINTRN